MLTCQLIPLGLPMAITCPTSPSNAAVGDVMMLFPTTMFAPPVGVPAGAVDVAIVIGVGGIDSVPSQAANWIVGPVTIVWATATKYHWPVTIPDGNNVVSGVAVQTPSVVLAAATNCRVDVVVPMRMP